MILFFWVRKLFGLCKINSSEIAFGFVLCRFQGLIVWSLILFWLLRVGFGFGYFEV